MNGLTWIDILLRLIPEGLIIILAGYAISKKSVNIKPYLLSSIIFALITFLVKILPVSTALPMILSAITAVLLLVFINKIKVIHAVISTIICLLLSVLFEGLNIFMLEKIFSIGTNEIYNNANPVFKQLVMLPSLLLFAAVVIIYYFIMIKITKKNVTKNVTIE